MLRKGQNSLSTLRTGRTVGEAQMTDPEVDMTDLVPQMINWSCVYRTVPEARLADSQVGWTDPECQISHVCNIYSF